MYSIRELPINFYDVTEPLGITGVIPGSFINYFSNDDPKNKNLLSIRVPNNFRQFNDSSWGYKFNNYSYRCEDFDANKVEDFLFIGCSYTFGEGTPLEHTWGYKFLRLFEEKNQLKPNSLKYYSIGYPGASIGGNILHIISVLKKFKFKNIVGLFPGQHRLVYVYPNKKNEQVFFDTHPEFINYIGEKNEKINVFNFYKHTSSSMLESNFLNSVFSLKMLSEANNSKFYWGTWDPVQNESYTQSKSNTNNKNLLLESFIPINFQINGFYDISYRARDGLHPPKEYYESIAKSYVQYF